MLSDKQLIQVLQNDTIDGIQSIIGAYGGLLTSVALRILKNPQEAEECAADAFISLWKNAQNVKKIESLKGYLITATRNNAISRYRKMKRHNEISVCDIGEGYEIIADEDVELLVIKKEFAEEVQDFVMKLPEPNREIFTRKYFLFETIKEIAEKLGLSEVQVKDRLYRTRKQVQKNFKEIRGDYEEIIFTVS